MSSAIVDHIILYYFQQQQDASEVQRCICNKETNKILFMHT